MWAYRVILTPDTNGTLLVDVPDLPEAHTFGKNEAEALRRGRDVIATVLDARIRDRRPIPAPSPAVAGQVTVAVSLLQTLKVDLYRAMNERGLRKSDLATMLDVHPPQVDRLLDLGYASQLKQLEAALAAVGRRVVTVQVGPVGDVPSLTSTWTKKRRTAPARRKPAAQPGRLRLSR